MEIKSNKISFTLKNGEIILLNEDDYQAIIEKIKMDVVIKLMADHPQKVYFERDFNENKVANLYRIVKENERNMSEDLKENYFKAILELSKSQDKSLVSLKDAMEENKNEPKP